MKPINLDNVAEIERTLLECNVDDSRRFEIINKALNCKTQYTTLSAALTVGRDENQFVILDQENQYTLNYNGIKGSVIFSLWKTVINKTKPSLNLGITFHNENSEAFLGEWFYQIDFFDALEDTKNIYIVRDVTQLMFYQEAEIFNRKIITYQDKKYLVLTEFAIADLWHKQKKSQVLSEIIYHTLECALINEELKIKG